MSTVQEMLEEIIYEAEDREGRVPAKLQEQIDNFEQQAEEAIEMIEEVDSEYEYLLQELYKLDNEPEEANDDAGEGDGYNAVAEKDMAEWGDD